MKNKKKFYDSIACGDLRDSVLYRACIAYIKAYRAYKASEAYSKAIESLGA